MRLCFCFDVFAQKKKKRKPGRHFWVVCFFLLLFWLSRRLGWPAASSQRASILVAPRRFTVFEVRGLIRMQSTTRVSGLHSPLWPPVCPPAVQQLHCLALTWLNLGAPGDSEPRGAGTTHLCFDCIFPLLYLYLLLSVA